MKILLSNDDGLKGYGLNPLFHRLSEIAEVFIVVPDREKSAVSHSITLHKPVRLIEHKKNIYTVSGTPADSVRSGLGSIIKTKIDMVVSGINNGPNLGEDCIYSGTVAAAREGAMLGYPAVAFSLVTAGVGRHFKTAADISVKIIEAVKKIRFPKYTLLNINIPDTSAIKGIKFTRLGSRIYDRHVEERIDPRNRKYYWIGGSRLSGHMVPGTDIYALDKGYVSITPLKVDQTDYSVLEKLNNSGFRLD